ncbi:MAG: EVE domain-containing protein [Acidobacteria bacterium]|nr:EVE domain-containing protein [Acidobacteriota bacterium]
MNACWLLKTEPDVYSYDDLERDRKTVWDGVSNNLALKHLRAMHKGDAALIYHTGDERRLVGLAEIISDPYADPKLDEPKRVVVDIKPRQRLKQAVSLETIKSRKEFVDFALVRLPRLSVMPVTEKQLKALMALAGT